MALSKLVLVFSFKVVAFLPSRDTASAFSDLKLLKSAFVFKNQVLLVSVSAQFGIHVVPADDSTLRLGCYNFLFEKKIFLSLA